MRAWLCVAAAALALALSSPPAAAEAESARLDHIKRQILAKLGLHTRPTPVRAMPRDVVRQILERAVDPEPPPAQPEHLSTREIIAIATRGKNILLKNSTQLKAIDASRSILLELHNI